MDNIVEYIISQEFIKDLKKNKKYIILTDGELGKDSEHIERISFANLITKNKIIDNNIITICIAEKLTSRDIIQIIPYLPTHHHWISLNPGFISLKDKNMPEENDITDMMKHGYLISEVYSTKHLQHTINNEIMNTYSRISDLSLPTTLAKLGKQSDAALFISGNKISSDLTIVTTASCIDKVASAIHLYTQGSSEMFDLYVIPTIQTELSEELKDSIMRTQRVLYIMDHKATEQICALIQAIVEHNCGNGIHLHYLFPQAHLIQSILSEYMEEEALFDRDSIAKFIESVLQD